MIETSGARLTGLSLSLKDKTDLSTSPNLSIFSQQATSGFLLELGTVRPLKR